MEFERLSHSDLIKWTRKRFRLNKLKISDEDLNTFILQAGNNLEDIKNEVEKLASYAGKSDLITRKQSISLSPVSGIYGFPVYRCSIGQRKATALEQMEIPLEQEQLYSAYWP